MTTNNHPYTPWKFPGTAPCSHLYWKTILVEMQGICRHRTITQLNILTSWANEIWSNYWELLVISSSTQSLSLSRSLRRIWAFHRSKNLLTVINEKITIPEDLINSLSFRRIINGKTLRAIHINALPSKHLYFILFWAWKGNPVQVIFLYKQ